jgi:ribosomal protein S14
MVLRTCNIEVTNRALAPKFPNSGRPRNVCVRTIRPAHTALRDPPDLLLTEKHEEESEEQPRESPQYPAVVREKVSGVKRTDCRRCHMEHGAKHSLNLAASCFDQESDRLH